MSYFFSAIASLFLWRSGHQDAHPAHTASPTEHGVALPQWDPSARSTLVHFAIPSLMEDVETRTAIRQTWLQDLKNMGLEGMHASYKFYIGRSKLDHANKVIDEENGTFHDIERVDEIDEWQGKVYKVIEAMGHVMEKYPARYLVVVEDETFVNVPALMSLLLARDSQHNHNDSMYGGRLVQTSVIRDRNVRYYVSPKDHPADIYDKYAESVGYVVGRPVCAALYAVRHLWKTLPIDDINFGHWLGELRTKQQFEMDKCEYVEWNELIKDQPDPKTIFNTGARTPQLMQMLHHTYQTYRQHHPDVMRSMLGEFQHKVET